MLLGRIWVFPIKSLDGVSMESACLTAGGALAHDRAFAIVDADGRVVNAKRTARIQGIRSAFSADFAEVELWTEDDPRRERFALAERPPLERWLGRFFGFPVRLRHDAHAGFPDDPIASGPTITSEASLAAVAGWFPEVDAEGIRGRFRTNLELRDGDAFAEDALFGAAGEPRPFRLGSVRFFAHNPCQRCVVPTRDPVRGEVVAGFQKRFMTHREGGLPAWADRRRFNHFYRFAVNTSVPASEAGKILRLGDRLGK